MGIWRCYNILTSRRSIGSTWSRFVLRLGIADEIDADIFSFLIDPPKNINTAKTSEIGKFNTKDTQSIDLTEADQKQYDKWNYVNIRHFQKEIVEFMRYEEVLVKFRCEYFKK